MTTTKPDPNPQRCPECGAAWLDGQSCTDHFHQMLAWEFSDPAAGVVHHLTVLCYYLQHPSLLSAEGRKAMQQLLADFVENAVAPQEMRRRIQQQMGQDKRQWELKGASSYEPPITWTQHIQDATRSGLENYAEHVREWASAVHQDLQTYKATHSG